MGWNTLSTDNVTYHLDELKKEGVTLINRMKRDIQESTRISLSDFTHIFGLRCCKNNDIT